MLLSKLRKGRKVIVCLLLTGLLFYLTACSTEIDPVNPYDPKSPEGLQKKGKIVGRVVLENPSDMGVVKVNVSVKNTSHTAIANNDGSFTLDEIPAGVYTVKVVPDDIGYKEREIGEVNVGIGRRVDRDLSRFLCLKSGIEHLHYFVPR
jgi:hypothetical protein